MNDMSMARRLTVEEVQEIYRRANAGEKGTELAEEFDIATCTVSAIKHRNRWAKFTGEEDGNVQSISAGRD